MRQIKTISLLLMTVAMMMSCLNSSDSDSTSYTDAAISSFSIGSLKRTQHTTSSTGADSTYTTTVSGAAYDFEIDHTGCRIFNPDSLPMGTDVSRVLVTMSAYNNGTILIKDVASDTLRLYNSTDSLDFTKPRIITALSNDGQGTRNYTVNVNVHQEDPYAFVWKLMSNDWSPENTDDAEDNLPPGIKCILGRSTKEEYALSTDNRMMVLSEGSTEWEEDLLNDDAKLLPTEDVSLVCYPMALTPNTDYVLIAGNRDANAYPQETIARVWRKTVDNDEQAERGVWTYMERPADALYQLPRMENLSLIYYDDSILAFGMPFTDIYQSRDNGITWKTGKTYQMPKDFDYVKTTSVKVVVDHDNYIWLYCSGSGQLWRGALNKLKN